MKSIGINLDIRAGVSMHMNMRPLEVWDRVGGIGEMGQAERWREGEGREEKAKRERKGDRQREEREL